MYPSNLWCAFLCLYIVLWLSNYKCTEAKLVTNWRWNGGYMHVVCIEGLLHERFANSLCWYLTLQLSVTVCSWSLSKHMTMYVPHNRFIVLLSMCYHIRSSLSGQKFIKFISSKIWSGILWYVCRAQNSLNWWHIFSLIMFWIRIYATSWLAIYPLPL